MARTQSKENEENVVDNNNRIGDLVAAGVHRPFRREDRSGDGRCRAKETTAGLIGRRGVVALTLGWGLVVKRCSMLGWPPC